MPTLFNPFAHPVPPLTDNAVLCVVVDLAGDNDNWLDAARRYVTPGELAQAGRYHRQADATRHLVGRALARGLLARELGRPRLNEEFAANPWGKPLLSGCAYQFNISHSGERVCLALSRGIAVGIDIERDEAATDPHTLAEIFHPAECAAIQALPLAAARDMFLRCWTRKEAVVKALGEGLSMPLANFRVRVDAHPADWLSDAPDGFPQGWTCRDLAVGDGYHASVAAACHGLFFSCHRIQSFIPDDIRV